MSPETAASKPVILGIFAATYLGIAAGRVPGLKLDRTGITLLGAICMMAFGHITTANAISFINWPTVFLLFGFFVISAQLRLSGFYDQVAAAISARLDHPARFLAALMAVSGSLSAVLNHDIVCYVFAPIIGAALLKKGLNPVPFLIALAISSNIGSAATLVGNPQNMMIGEVAHLSFARYLFWALVPVFFAMGCAYGIIWMMSRKTIQQTHRVKEGNPQPVTPLDRSHTIKGLVILALVLALFFSSLPKEIIVLTAAGIHLASPKFGTEELMGLVDWPLLILFMALFVVTGAFQSTDYGGQAVHWLNHAGFDLGVSANLVLLTGVMTNLISNAPTVMLLLGVIQPASHTAASILAVANSFAGSLLIIGSVANIIVIQQARQAGIKISFWDFARLGIPTTLAALAGLIAWVALAA